MTDQAKANPEKRLFISLITRDIGLVDAIVDLTDNSVNAAMKTTRNSFSSATDYYRLFAKSDHNPQVDIDVTFDETSVTVVDNAGGIDFDSAKEEIFRFGHSRSYHESKDRLSVYGIGMKRALFKIGNDISMVSDHKSGGFSLRLNVDRWARDEAVPWTIPIERRPPAPASKTGTTIVIRKLREEIRARVSDGRFEDDLIEKLTKVYSYFVGRLVRVTVNTKPVKGAQFELGSNFAHDKFTSHGVSCSITAGIPKIASGSQFTADFSGWFIFCNFRTVIYADKTSLTGWGATLPQFQPKHRPFLGLVFFNASDPELLPWTTTKGSLNEDNLVWQDAKTRMAAVARPLLKFLDTRYPESGVEIQTAQLAHLSKETSNAFAATVSKVRTFEAPKPSPTTRHIRIQYDALKSEIEKVKKHFSRSTMSASEVGRRTFDFFLRNEIGE